MAQANKKLTAAIANIVQQLGLKTDDVVMVHSGISTLATLVKNQTFSPREILDSLHLALLSTVGPKGTIVTPAFFYDYARRNKPFHVDRSPPDQMLGLYPRYMFGIEGCKRSLNPIGSLQAVGQHAEQICAHESANGFGLVSPWTHLLELKGKCLIIGTPYIMTFPHYVEALLGVPHVYNKIYHTPVYIEGVQIEFPVITQVRYLKYGIEYMPNRTESELTDRGILKTAAMREINAQIANFNEVYDFLVEKLNDDPYYLLENPPNFVSGEPPDDGPASRLK